MPKITMDSNFTNTPATDLVHVRVVSEVVTWHRGLRMPQLFGSHWCQDRECVETAGLPGRVVVQISINYVKQGEEKVNLSHDRSTISSFLRICRILLLEVKKEKSENFFPITKLIKSVTRKYNIFLPSQVVVSQAFKNRKLVGKIFSSNKILGELTTK